MRACVRACGQMGLSAWVCLLRMFGGTRASKAVLISTIPPHHRRDWGLLLLVDDRFSKGGKYIGGQRYIAVVLCGHACVCARVYAWACVHVRTYVCICGHACMCARVYVWACVHVRTCVCVGVCACAYMCMCGRVCLLMLMRDCRWMPNPTSTCSSC